MNKTRIPLLIIAIALVASAALALRTYYRTANVQASQPTFSGFGELRRFEAQQELSASSARVVGHATSFSMSENAIAPNRAPYSSTGFGELRRVEAQQARQSHCPNLSSPSGEHDAGASAPAYVLRAMGCSIP